MVVHITPLKIVKLNNSILWNEVELNPLKINFNLTFQEFGIFFSTQPKNDSASFYFDAETVVTLQSYRNCNKKE